MTSYNVIQKEGYMAMIGNKCIGNFATEEGAKLVIFSSALREVGEEGGLILDYGDGLTLEVIPNLDSQRMEIVERLSDGENIIHCVDGYSVWLDIMVDCSRVGYKFDGDFGEYDDGLDG